MIPIQRLLQRIRWDAGFARARFSIGIYDRIEARVVLVAFSRLRFAPGERFAFEYEDEQGEVHSVPYHRVRVVYRDGVAIWKRRVLSDTQPYHRPRRRDGRR